MSEPWHEATLDAMDGDCEIDVGIVHRVYGEPDEVVTCGTHGCDWRDDEDIACDVYRETDRAVRIGYEAGRRAGITEAADAITPEPGSRDFARLGGPQIAKAFADRTRSLLTATREADQ